MIGSVRLVVECVCGHGDDGKHTVAEVFGMPIIGCPYCPPQQLFIFGAARTVSIVNAGERP